jgi:NIPSNAP
MVTLSIRYTIDPNKLADFKTYVHAEQEPIRRSGGKVVGYFFPTDFAGPTNEALGLIDLPNVAAYEQYRNTLAKDPDHKKNASCLEQSGAVMAMNRSIIQRLESNQHE